MGVLKRFKKSLNTNDLLMTVGRATREECKSGRAQETNNKPSRVTPSWSKRTCIPSPVNQVPHAPFRCKPSPPRPKPRRWLARGAMAQLAPFQPTNFSRFNTPRCLENGSLPLVSGLCACVSPRWYYRLLHCICVIVFVVCGHAAPRDVCEVALGAHLRRKKRDR